MTKQIVTKRVKPDDSGWTVAAGATNVASSIIDTAGAESVRFIVGFGAIVSGAVVSINVQQDTDSAGGTMADLEGTKVTIADTDDNKIAIVEVVHPRERYLRLEILRATQNATVDFLIVELYYPRKAPVTQDTVTLVAPEVHISPAEGTA